MKKLYISESERHEILKKHNSKLMLEENPPAQQNFTITDLQNALIKAGKNPGTVDGQFGPKTLAAIEQAIGATTPTTTTQNTTTTSTVTTPPSGTQGTGITSLETKKVTSLKTDGGKVTGVETTNVGGTGAATKSETL